mgnify:FL=1|jgi:hypothetical protein
MSDEVLGLVRETLMEMRELRADVSATNRSFEDFRVEVDTRLDEMRRLITVDQAAASSAKSWPDVVSEIFGHKLVQYAVIIGSMGLAGVSAAELRSAILGGSVELEVDDEMPLDDDDAEEATPAE